MKPQSDLHSIEEIPWTEIPEIRSSARGQGIKEKILSIDPDNPNNITRLTKSDAGFRSPRLSHPFWEEIYIVKGILVDEGNGVVGKAGDYCCRRPGMLHGPIYHPEESICFEIHYIPKKQRKPQLDFHSIEGIPWTEIPDTASSSRGWGVKEKILSIDPDNPHNLTRLASSEANFKGPRLSHPFWEEIYIVKGVLVDEGNGVSGKAGDYCCRRPGMLHGPMNHPVESICFEVHYVPK